MKEFIEALKAHLQSRFGFYVDERDFSSTVLSEIDAFSAAWPTSEHNPANYPAPAGKIDTSPAALMALADEWDVEGIPIWHTLAQTLRAVADEKEAEGWQPIDTAPKDGTVIRAFSPEFIDLDFNQNGSVECVFNGEEFIGCIWNGQHDTWYGQAIKPTHWMPLPEGPKT